MKYRTILADPPWSYQKTTRHAKLSGYSDVEYSPLSTDDLAALPLGEMADENNAVLLLWTTFPFVGDALRLIDAWGFQYVTGLPWVKTSANVTNLSYGVGYWFRGAAELLLVGKRGKAYRTNLCGLLSETEDDPLTGLVAPRLNHSRKPDTVYELAECFDGPYLEVFARRQQPGWSAVGNEAPGDGKDIRETLKFLTEAGGPCNNAPVTSTTPTEEGQHHAHAEQECGIT